MNTKRFIIKSVIIVIMIVIMFFIAGSRPKISAYGYDTCRTLWDLADEHCPASIDKRDFIDTVVKINGMDGYTVYPDRLYQYPIYEGAK